MTSGTTRRFRELLAHFPPTFVRKPPRPIATFATTRITPACTLKKVHPTLPIYSARINDDYRVVGQLRSNGIVGFWIGKQEWYERLLKSL